jgi:integrase
MLVEALRVSEVVCLRSADLVREGLWVRQKGLRGERALKAISDETHQLLTAYIARAGKLDTTWLFEGSNFRDHVSSRTLQRAIARLGEEVLGRRVRCHGLRHTSITKAVESGGIANAMLHARHKYPKTTMRYFDTKSISQLQTATTLSDAASPSRHIEPPTETPHVPLVGRGPTDHRGSE